MQILRGRNVLAFICSLLMIVVFSSCEKEEVTQVKKVNINRTVNNSSVFKIDTISTSMSDECPYCYYVEYPETPNNQRLFPIVYIKFDDEFLPFPVTYFVGDEYLKLNYWTDNAGTYIFGEDGSPGFPSPINVEIIYVWMLVE